jgi:hypothetical protein
MRRMLSLGGVLALLCFSTAAAAGDSEQTGDLCYWCMRDAIYADISLIDHLEANPDIDDGVKGPQISAARAEIHRLRAILGPAVDVGPQPCCYSRRPLYIR